MGWSRQCPPDGLYKGAWTSNEDKMLTDYVKVHGEGKWNNVAKRTDLKRSGKSCRLRWKNYLKSDIKRGNISHDEEELIIRLHKLLGNRWSLIAGRLPGRTDNEIKNYWKTTLAKRAKDFKMKVFTPIGNVNEVLPTMCQANVKLTSQAVLVDTAVQSEKNPYGANNISIGPSTENYTSRKMEYEFNDALPSSLPQLKDHANATDFLMNDDKVFGRGIVRMNDEKVSPNGGGGGGGDDGDGDSSFLNKLVAADTESSLNFKSLASSFLESAEEWSPINVNILAFNQEK